MKIILSILVGLLLSATALGNDRFVITKERTNSVVQNKRIFFNDTYFFGQNGFFDVGDNLRVNNVEYTLYEIQQQNTAIREELDVIRKQISDLNKRVNKLSTNNSGSLVNPYIDDNRSPGIPNDIFPVPPRQEFGGFIEDKDNLPTENITGQITNLFRNKCADCHSDGDNRISIFENGTLSSFSARQIQEIHNRTLLSPEKLKSMGKTPMPKGDTLSESEKMLISDWVQSLLK